MDCETSVDRASNEDEELAGSESEGAEDLIGTWD